MLLKSSSDVMKCQFLLKSWVKHDRPDDAWKDLQWSHLLTKQASKFPSKCLRSPWVMNRVCLRIFKQEHSCVCDCCGKCRSWSGAMSHSLTWPWAGHQHGSSHRLACLFPHLRVDPNRCHCIAQMQRLPLREMKYSFQNVVVAEVKLISLSCYEGSFLLLRPKNLMRGQSGSLLVPSQPSVVTCVKHFCDSHQDFLLFRWRTEFCNW